MRIIISLFNGQNHIVVLPSSFTTERVVVSRLPEVLAFVSATLGDTTVPELSDIQFENGSTVSVEYLSLARQAYGIRNNWTRYYVTFYTPSRADCTTEYVVGCSSEQALLDAKVLGMMQDRPRGRYNSGIYTISRQDSDGDYEQVDDNDSCGLPIRYRIPMHSSTVFTSVGVFTGNRWTVTNVHAHQRGNFPVGPMLAFKCAHYNNHTIQTSDDYRVNNIPQWMYGVARILRALTDNPDLVLEHYAQRVVNPATGQFDTMYGQSNSEAAQNMRLYYGTYVATVALTPVQILQIANVSSYDYNTDGDWLRLRNREREHRIAEEVQNQVRQAVTEDYPPRYTQVWEMANPDPDPLQRILNRATTPAPARAQPPRSPWYPTDNPQPIISRTIPQMQLPPEMPNRRFGIEIEFDPGNHSQLEYQQAIDSVLRSQLGVRVQSLGYHHSNGTTWDLKTDSSCGLELATPALRWPQWPVVAQVLAAIRQVGGVATAQCGVHIHHEFNDVRVTGLRRMYLLWYAYENLLFRMVHPSRSSNYYCAPIRQYGSFDLLRQRMGSGASIQQISRTLGKYRSLNTLPWWNSTRVEVRMHHGTLDAEDVKFWTAITQQMVERSRMVQTYAPLQEISEMSIDEQLIRLKRRYSLDQILNPAIDAAMQRGVVNA